MKEAPMKIRNLRRTTTIATVLWLASSTVSMAQPVNPLLSLIDTSCVGDDFGKVTRVTLLNSKQVNAIFRKSRAYEDARAGETWVQIFVRSKALPNDYSLRKIDKLPTASEIAEIVGKPACTYSAG